MEMRSRDFLVFREKNLSGMLWEKCPFIDTTMV